MDCERMDSILDDHAAGALSAAQKAEVADHLAGCRRCADAWLSHETLLRETPEGPSAAFVERTLAIVAAESGAQAAVRPVRRTAVSIGIAAAAVTLVAVMLGIELAGDGPGESVPESVVTPVRVAAGPDAGGFAAVAGRPASLTAGVDYERLPAPAPTSVAAGRIEVCEFFMFGCIHCFGFEPMLEAWSRAQPDDVELVRVPALFNASARLHAQAFYAAEALGRLDSLIAPFYEAIHLRGNPLATRDAVRSLFAQHGVDPATFDRVFDSPDVARRLQQAEDLNRRYRVDATPSIGVNGKYLTHAGMAGSNEALLDVVDALVEAERELAECPGGADSACPIGARR